MLFWLNLIVNKLLKPAGKVLLILGATIIAKDVLKLKRSFSHCGILWTRREANCVPHEVVKLSLSRNLSFKFVS